MTNQDLKRYVELGNTSIYHTDFNVRRVEYDILKAKIECQMNSTKDLTKHIGFIESQLTHCKEFERTLIIENEKLKANNELFRTIIKDISIERDDYKDKYNGHRDAYYHALELYYKSIDTIGTLNSKLKRRQELYDESQQLVVKRNLELKYVKRKLSKTPILPKGWSDFKIVETNTSGCFTSQIFIKDHIVDWPESSRLQLIQYTKDYIEMKTGLRVERKLHEHGKCGSCQSLYVCGCKVEKI